MTPAAERTIGGFLMEKMDGGERRRRRAVKRRRMGFRPFRCIVCCGAGSPAVNFPDEEDTSPVDREPEPSPAGFPDPGCVSGMNLAEALAAERHLRAEDAARSRETADRVSLMRLLTEENGGGERGCCCCVCMIGEKGAAFIPCGHTFCRICSRDLWLNRGTCPLCNRRIVEILDIF